MTGSRLHAVHVATRGLGVSRRLWVDLLGGTVVESWPDRLDIVSPPGVVVSLREVPGEPGVTGVELGVPDPEAMAGLLADEHGLAVDERDGTLQVDARPVLGGVLGLVALEVSEVPDADGGGAAGVETLDHVCFGVVDLAGASELLRATGGVATFGGDSPFGIRSLHMSYDVGKVELLTPLRDDSEVGRHLARRGGSASHHVTLLVGDVPHARAAAHDLGFETTWTNLEHPAWKDTYLRPASTGGLVVQLAVTTEKHDAPLSRDAFDGVFNGDWWVAFHQMRPIEEVST